MTSTERTRTARCACGGLTAEATGEPTGAYLCSCHECQRRSGSAFSYAGTWPERAVTISGERKSFRQTRESGRWNEMVFCPACGVTVYWRVEALPGTIGIPAGCFADADFPPPQRLYWAAQRPHWLSPPAGVEVIETQ